VTVHGTDTTTTDCLREQVRSECRGRLCVHRNGLPAKTRRYVVAAGFSPEHNLGVYNNNTNTIERAFIERYFLCAEAGGFRPALDVAPNTFESTLFSTFHHRVMDAMPYLPRLSRRQVVDRYSGTKRRVYEEALISLQRKSLNAEDARLSSFVKFEKQDVGKAPRVINPRKPRYNLCLGQYIKHAEKPFFRAINCAFGARTPLTVIKGVNSEVSANILRQKWDLFAKPVAVGLDASKFDMHVSLEALKYEHSFYQALFPGSGELKKILSWQLHNSGRAYAADGMVEFAMRGTRCSGDLNTSLGNCLIMCALIHVYARVRGVDVELANNGDDCVVFMEADDLGRFLSDLDRWFHRHGFAMVAEEPVYEFEHVEFCQTRPVQLSTGWRMMRNHSAILRKDPMCLIPIPNDATYKKWLHAVGVCGTIGASGCPVQESLYQMFLRCGSTSSAAMREYIHRGGATYQRNHNLKKAQVTPQARVSYYYAFGLKPDEQVELERYFDGGVFERVQLEPISRDALVVEPGIINLTV